ncbi:MAG: polysaccharide biosynthesis C-terminal domain-containing protein [Acidimicrobiia bacterium]|nr:polysaccharide biosynthesis C-terminal domain-containing protein [Acidimicrobiia bacterium]
MGPRQIWSRIWGAFDGLARDTLWAGALDIAAVLSAVLSFYLLQQSLTREHYGALFGLYGVVAPLGSLTFAGPGLAVLQRRIRYKEDLSEILKSILSLVLMIGLVTSSAAAILAFLFIELSSIEIILIIISELFVSSMVFVCSRLVQAAIGYPAMVRVKMVMVVLKTTAVTGLFLLDILTVRNLAASYLLFYGCYVTWLLTRRLPAIGYTVSLGRPSVNVIKSSAVFAVPMAAAGLQADGDKFALNVFNFTADAGLYGAAYRVVQLGSMPLRVVGQAAFHRFLPDDAVGTGHHLRKSARLTAFMFGLGVTTAAAMYAASPLLDFFFSEEFTEAQSIVPWLLLFVPLVALSGTPMNGLLGLGRAKERAAIYLLSGVVSITLYFVLIPGRGWQGAVAATVLSELFLAIASWTAILFYQRHADRERFGRPRQPLPEPESAST